MGFSGGPSNYQQFTGSISTTTALKGGSAQVRYPGSLTRVTITEDAAIAVVFYDATSSEAVGGAFSTRIADFAAAATEGTYEFDAAFTRGLMMVAETDATAFAGDWTVMWQ